MRERIRVAVSRVAAWLRMRSADEEFCEELGQHLELLTEENMRRGMNPEEARRAARVRLGGATQLREVNRELRGLPFLETLAQDVRYGLRMLGKSPAFTAIAVMTLALGVGANTAIFSLVNSVLLRPLSYRQPERLYVIREIISQWKSLPSLAVNLPDFQIWQKECRSFDEISIAEATEVDFSGSGEAEEIYGIRASANLFDLLGQSPTLGRSFRAEEDQAGHDRAVILTDGFWRSRFHSDAGIIGRTITLDGDPHVVVGVLPASFHLPKAVGSESLGARVDFFRPLGGARFYEQDLIGEFDFVAIARLKDGVTRSQALAELNTVQAGIAKQANENVDLAATLLPLEPQIVGAARSGLMLLLAAVGVVLLIVCVNLANLLLARVPNRMREAAIRNALGAAPRRLRRQLLTESLLLALIGGTLGTALAYWGMRALVVSAPVGIPRLEEVRMDGRVLGFAFALSAFVGVLFGMLPAWRVSRADPQETLKVGATTATEGGQALRIRESLIGFEVGLCTALLILAGLLASSLFHVIQVNPGFGIERVLAADVDLPPQGYSQEPARARFYERVLAELRTSPGVEAAGWVTVLPLDGQGSVTGISLPGAQDRSNEALHANYRAISPDYFRTMGIPLVDGRLFNDNDRGKKVVAVSRGLADRLWPGQSPIGRKCIAQWGQLQLQESEVVGVAGDIRTVSLEAPPLLMVYVPDSYGQQTPGAPGSASIVVRTAADPDVVAGSLRSIIQNADPNVPILALRPMKEVVSQTLGTRRFQTSLAVLFAASALLLASLGVYGVVSYNVERRSFELGIRLVLGAEHGRLLGLVLRQGMVPVAFGLAGGIAAAAAGAHFIQTLLFGVGAFDAITFCGVAAVVTAVAAAACYLPARRTLRLDPMAALRYE